MVFTTRFAHGGANLPQRPRERTHRTPTSARRTRRPNHPTTCGKVERFQLTMKKWLRTQPAVTSLTELQQPSSTRSSTSTTTIDPTVHSHTTQHPPLPTKHDRKPPPATPTPTTTSRVRRDRVHSGNISLRVDGHMHHIGVGRTLDGTPVLLLINGLRHPHHPRHHRRNHPHPHHQPPTPTTTATGKPTGRDPKDPEKSKRSGP